MSRAGRIQDFKIHQSCVDTHPVGRPGFGPPVRHTTALRATVETDRAIIPHVSACRATVDRDVHYRIIRPQYAVTTTDRACALGHFRWRVLKYQRDGCAMAAGLDGQSLCSPSLRPRYQSTVVGSSSTPTCVWAGAKCGTNINCCSGACVKGVCN